jgi:transposase
MAEKEKIEETRRMIEDVLAQIRKNRPKDAPPKILEEAFADLLKLLSMMENG